MTVAAVDLTIEAKLDALAEQLAFLTREAEVQQASRRRWQDLSSEAMPILSSAMERTAAELDDIDFDLEALLALGKRLAASAATLDRLVVSLEAGVALIGELSSMSGAMLQEASDRLADLEQRGYFSFAKAGVGVVDEVVANFGEEDVRRLGENVVLILNVVKDLTQPEILSVVKRMLEAMERQRLAMADEPADPPSLWQLARQARQPEVRRGLSRALNTLRAVTEADAPTTSS